MALTLYTNVSGTITQLNDNNPFRLESAEGLSGADVIRYEQRGPFQSGATDLGFNLNARIITLHLLFTATSASQLDTYRSTLTSAFKPLDSTSIFLSVQRDDGEIRTLTCFTVGDIAISLVVEEFPGHLHRATVNLRAASPLWQANGATIGSADFTGLTSWWLAGGAISSGNVMYHTESPAADTPVSPFAGTITGDWSVVVVTAKDTTSSLHYVWADGLGGSASFRQVSANHYAIQDVDVTGTAWPGTTGANYHVVESRGTVQHWRYWTAGSITDYANNSGLGTVGTDVSLSGVHSGTSFTFRGHRINSGSAWNQELRKAAIYGTVTVNQLQALGPYLLNGLFPGTVNVVNDGDVYAYPIMTLTGPMADPVIVNTTTASTVNLTGITLASGDIVTVDLRNGNKQIYNQSGSTLLGSVTTFPIALASFNLAPSPVASGGTNTFVLTPGSVGSAATFSVQITNQYLSF